MGPGREQSRYTLEVSDRQGRTVRYTKSNYERHVKKHPEIDGYLDAIAETIREPDIEIGADNGNIYLYRSGVGRGRYAKLWLFVVVLYESAGLEYEGVVKTSYFTSKIAKDWEGNMAEVRPLDIEEIRRANFDLAERVEAEEITLEYNPEADVLSITLGEPRPAITEPLLDDIMYRIDPDTLKIAGVEIVAFFSDFVRRNKLVRKLLRNYLEELHLGKTHIVVTDPHDRELFGEVLVSIS